MRSWRDDQVIARAAPFFLLIGFLILGSAPPLVLAVQDAEDAALSLSWLAVLRSRDCFASAVVWARLHRASPAAPARPMY